MGNLDMLQLVSRTVRVYDPFSKTMYDESMVKEKYGVAPSKMADYLTLVGDRGKRGEHFDSMYLETGF